MVVNKFFYSLVFSSFLPAISFSVQYNAIQIEFDRSPPEPGKKINNQKNKVLGVWNTFFPTSHWDNDTSKGTQTVNPIVLVELNGDDGASYEEVKLDETSAEYRWISLDPDVAEANGEDKYVLQALLRLREWDPNYHKVC